MVLRRVLIVFLHFLTNVIIQDIIFVSIWGLALHDTTLVDLVFCIFLTTIVLSVDFTGSSLLQRNSEKPKRIIHFIYLLFALPIIVWLVFGVTQSLTSEMNSLFSLVMTLVTEAGLFFERIALVRKT